MARAHELDKPFLKVLLADMAAEHESKTFKWFGEGGGESVYAPGGSLIESAGQQHLSDISKKTLRFLVLDSSLAIKRRAMEWGVDLEGGVTSCLSVVSQIVDQVDVLATSGLLNFMHDVTAATLSEVTLLLYKVSDAPQNASDYRSSGVSRITKNRWLSG
jgi:hypothetical protein